MARVNHKVHIILFGNVVNLLKNYSNAIFFSTYALCPQNYYMCIHIEIKPQLHFTTFPIHSPFPTAKFISINIKDENSPFNLNLNRSHLLAYQPPFSIVVRNFVLLT